MMEDTEASLSAKRWGIFHNLSTRFVDSNKYILNGCTKPWQLISFVENRNEITINLTDFTPEYTDKYISGKMKNYSNEFIDKFKPVLQIYLNEVKQDEQKFTIIFQIKMRTYEYEVAVLAK